MIKIKIDRKNFTPCTSGGYSKYPNIFPPDTKGFRVTGRSEYAEWYTEEAFDRYFEVVDPPA